MSGGDEARAARPAWLIVALLATAHLMAFCDRFAVAAVADQLEAAFRLSETGLGALQGLSIALPFVAAAALLGRFADRVPPRRLVLGGLALWTAGGFACAFSTSLLQLWAARMMIGAGQAGFVIGALAELAAAFPGPRLAQPLSVFTAGSTLGKSVALLASGLILSLAAGLPVLKPLFGGASWRAVFAFTTAPNLLLLLALALAPTGPAPAPKPQPAAGRGVRGLLTPAFVAYALTAVAPVVLIQAAAAWTPVFYMRTYHLAAARTAYLVGSVVLVCAPAGHLLGGRLAAAALRRGVPPGRLVAAGLAAAAPLGLLLCLAPRPAISLAAYGGVVLLLGMAGLPGLAGVSLLAPAGRAPSANALYMGFATLVGVGLGPTVVGMMSDAVFGGAGGLAASLIVLFLAVPLAAAATALAAERLRHGAAGKRAFAAPLGPGVADD